MTGEITCVASLHPLGHATVQQEGKLATDCAKSHATGSIKALAISVLRNISAQRSVQRGRKNGATGGEKLLHGAHPSAQGGSAPVPESAKAYTVNIGRDYAMKASPCPYTEAQLVELGAKYPHLISCGILPHPWHWRYRIDCAKCESPCMQGDGA